MELNGVLYSEPGTYESIDESGSSDGCQLTSILTLEILEEENVFYDIELNEGQVFEFEGESYNESGSFVVPTVSENGCIIDAYLEINVLENDISVFVPTAFSPNNDGVNDVFFPVFYLSPGLELNSYKFQIFNRWGVLVFTSEDLNESNWLGGYLEVDAYYQQDEIYQWTIEYTLNNDVEVDVINGTVTLIR